MTWNVKIDDKINFNKIVQSCLDSMWRDFTIYVIYSFWIVPEIIHRLLFIYNRYNRLLFRAKHSGRGLKSYNSIILFLIFFFTSWFTYYLAVKLLFPCILFNHSDRLHILKTHIFFSCVWVVKAGFCLISIYSHNCFIEASDPVLSNYSLFWE